jgi:hypothetical protein
MNFAAVNHAVFISGAARVKIKSCNFYKNYAVTDILN